MLRRSHATHAHLSPLLTVFCTERADNATISASQAAAAAIVEAQKTVKEQEAKESSDLVPPLPSNLRRRLVLDWEWLTRRNQIQRLPSRLPVVKLLAAFLHDHRTNCVREGKTEVDALGQQGVMQVCEGLLCYFERCLPAVLLYRIERPQMRQVVEKYGLTIPSPGQTDITPPVFSVEHMTRTLPSAALAANSLAASSSSSSSSSASPTSSGPFGTDFPSALSHCLPSADDGDDDSSVAAVIPQWSGVYGVEHLVRMLCKLPSILRDGEDEWLADQRSAVRYTLSSLYRWLGAHEDDLYRHSAYEQPSPDYMSKLQQPNHAPAGDGELAEQSNESRKQQSSGQVKVEVVQTRLPSKSKRKQQR